MYRLFYPTLFWKFLRGKKPVLREGVAKAEFLTFADSLWALCLSQKIPKKSVILLPNFYCSDVTKFFTKIGYRFEYYELDKNLQVVESSLKKMISFHNPSIIILLDALGIRCNLARDSKWIVEQCSKGRYVIEDRVHSLLNPADVRTHHERHITIDTLYKVSPFLCSRIFGKEKIINLLKDTQTGYWYGMKTIFVHSAYQFLLHLAYLLKNNNLQKQAEKVLTVLCERVIGFSKKPGKTSVLNQYFADHICYQKINDYKQKEFQSQIQLFNTTSFLSNNSLLMPFQKNEAMLLRGVPLYIENEKVLTFITEARNNHMLISIELGDSPWAQKHSASYLYF
jgi:hypothetical protein